MTRLDQAILHELGHAWMATELGYAVTVTIPAPSEADPRCKYAVGDVADQHWLMVTAAGLAAELVSGVDLASANRSAYDDLVNLVDCIGHDASEELTNQNVCLLSSLLPINNSRKK